MSRVMILAMAIVGILGGLVACGCGRDPKQKGEEAATTVHRHSWWHGEVMSLDVGDGVKCYLIKGTNSFSCVKVRL